MIWLEAWLQTPLAGAIGWTLFHSLWQGAIIAVVLAGVLTATRSARARYTAACLAMCVILVCFIVTLLSLAPRHAIAGPARNPIALNWNNGTVLAGGAEASLLRVADLLPWLVPFWMAGVLLFCLRHLAGWAWTLRLRRRGVCAAPDFWQERLTVLAQGLQLSTARCAARILPGASSCGDGTPASSDSHARGSADRLARSTD